MTNEDDRLWMTFLTVRLGEDDGPAARAKTKIGYRGLTRHTSGHEAKAKARELLAAAVEADSTLRWMVVWCKPYMEHRAYDPEAGRCLSLTHEPPAPA